MQLFIPFVCSFIRSFVIHSFSSSVSEAHPVEVAENLSRSDIPVSSSYFLCSPIL